MTEETNPTNLDRRAKLPCADHDRRISLTEQAVMSLKQTNEGMTTKLDLILAQITRVAILEEKHSTQQIDITRAHAKNEMLSRDLDVLSRETRSFISYSQGRDKVLWALSGVVLALLIKSLFFSAGLGMTV